MTAFPEVTALTTSRLSADESAPDRSIKGSPQSAPESVPRSGPESAPESRPESGAAGAGVPGGLVTVRPVPPDRRWKPPRALRRLAGPVLVLGLWYVLSATGALQSSVLSSPVDVARTGWRLTADGKLPGAMAVSGARVVYGFAIGAAAALVLALVAGLSRLGEDLVDSTVGMLRTVPFVGMVPLFIVWFGIDEAPKIALVALGVAFPLYFNLYGGIRDVDSRLIEAGTVLGLSRLGLIRRVILPGALPAAMVGVRVSLGTAWLALVFAEQLNASSGVGYLMNTAQQYYQTDVLVVCLVTYAVLGMIGDLAVRLLSRALLSWRASFDGV